MDTWIHGYDGGKVKNIIDRNFTILDGQVKNSILALSTTQRKVIDSRYLKNGLIVFDTTIMQWLKYDGKQWVPHSFPCVGYKKNLFVSDWTNNNITIPFSEHGIPNPTVQIYMITGNEDVSVLGGVDIDGNYNITLSTDLAFNGKVVIK